MTEQAATDVAFGDDGVESDPVVAELDVFVNTVFKNGVYCLQYPLRRPDMPYNETHDVLGVRIRSENQMVEMDLGINTSSADYDTQRGDSIASAYGRTNVGSDPANLEPGERLKTLKFNSGSMDKVQLKGKGIERSNQFAVGYIIHNQECGRGEVHLNNITSIVPLKPGIEFLDQIDQRKKAERQANGEEPAGEQEEEKQAKAVQVKFRNKDAAKAESQKKTYAGLVKREEGEPWRKLKYIGQDDEEAQMLREQLACTADTPVNLAQSDDEYFRALHSLPKEVEYLVRKERDHMSLSDLSRLPVDEQVVELLQRSGLVSFSSLNNVVHCADDGKYEIVLKAMETCGVLLHGNWVPNSRHVFPDNYRSPVTDMPATPLRQARDYILWLFSTETHIERVGLLKKCKILAPDLKAIMAKLATLDVVNGVLSWQLKLSTNADFIKNHPEVVTRQRRGMASSRDLFKSLLGADGLITIKSAGASKSRKKRVAK